MVDHPLDSKHKHRTQITLDDTKHLGKIEICARQ